MGSRIINVGGEKIGVSGLDEALEAMAGEFAQAGDEEVAAEMMARLEGRNYIVPRYREDYMAAFVREFRKHLGQEVTDEPGLGLEVRVVGPGCPACDQLHARLTKVLAEMGLAADLDKIKDAKAIAATGVLVTPGLMINGKVVSTGKVPAEKQIKDWLAKA